GTPGHTALANLVPWGQRMSHSPPPPGSLTCREKVPASAEPNLMPRQDYAPSGLPDGGPWHPVCDPPLVPPTREAGRTGTQCVFHPGEAAMTTLLSAHYQPSPTVLWATAHSPRKLPARYRPAVKDVPPLPGYEVLGVLGHGGMATVYKAQQLCPGRLVAVKVMDRSLAGYGEIVARFRQEQALGARLRHPNLIAVYEAGRAAGCPYLIMELVEGDNLDEILGRFGPLPVADACEVIRQAALGLQHLHEHCLVHRDVKPSNLMLTSGGEVKVLDLGLARHLYEPATGGADH